MKIYCEHCKQEISIDCDSHFEQYETGKVTCPHCRRVQKRYISEADLLTFFTFSELLYVVLVLITAVLFAIFGVGIIAIAAIFALLVIAYLLSKQLSRYIYTNGMFKKETMYKLFDEEGENIKKNMRWQFILFFALAITFATGTEFSLFFIAMMILSVVLSAVKMVLAVRKEKAEN